MKPIREQNFYEIFEIPIHATRAQIDQAYALAKKTYGDQSLAAYSLFDSEERKEIVRKVHLAYETLSDENRRRAYDQDVLGSAGPSKPNPSGSDPAGAVSSIPGPDSQNSPVQKSDPADIESMTGTELRQIRERRGIPLQEIASRTRINITYLEFLEKNQFRSLPPAVYLRSYVLQYARLLDLDAGRVADRILFLVEQAKRSEPA
ncbi:MAG TPA: helix-turn-helix domain-containing protein [Nitrospiria bacterium]|nr:helix-turn-helix domain-containing protein [Nitrospiria bacterium]HUK56454.1 helix-turn-helix domain-containing protein [Nitrospiria bacterium]